MNENFYIKRNDLLEVLEIIPYDGNGNPVNAALDDTVTFIMYIRGQEAKVSAPAVVIDTQDAEGNAVRGFRYVWEEGDTDTAGMYLGEFEWINGTKPHTFPNGLDQLIINITRDGG